MPPSCEHVIGTARVALTRAAALGSMCSRANDRASADSIKSSSVDGAAHSHTPELPADTGSTHGRSFSGSLAPFTGSQPPVCLQATQNLVAPSEMRFNRRRSPAFSAAIFLFSSSQMDARFSRARVRTSHSRSSPYERSTHVRSRKASVAAVGSPLSSQSKADSNSMSAYLGWDARTSSICRAAPSNTLNLRSARARLSPSTARVQPSRSSSSSALGSSASAAAYFAAASSSSPSSNAMSASGVDAASTDSEGGTRSRLPRKPGSGSGGLQLRAARTRPSW
mmetsp:Transcript_1362/g.5552  ORF Transcript_1362/g.5552 Transcript_1362/m.5552 type:complete len:281 (-) Transcript_1362:159-1001(-)